MAWTASTVTRRQIRRAIALIEDSKRSHLDAIEDPDNQILGDVKFHKKCVREYDYVLKVLRQAEQHG